MSGSYGYRSSRSSRSSGALVAVLLLGLLIGAFFLFAPYYSTHLWWFFRTTWFWVIPLLVLIVMGLFATVLLDGGGSGGGGMVLLTIVGAVGLFVWLFVYNYAQDTVYAESIRVIDDPVQEFEQRIPFSVSAAQVRSNLGDIPGDTQETMYVPDDESFSTLVEKRGSFTGYQTLLEQQISVTGRNVPAKCDFTAVADRRFGGLFSHSLGRLINTEQRWVSWDQSDAYGWCDDEGTPLVIVPLVEQEGVLIVTEKPAGVAIYNGRTGDLTIRSDAEGIPGPSYPLSLAAVQRESSVALNGFWDWFFNRAGWEQPDEADSINSGNDSEFVLAGVGGGEFFVTPQSGRGSATAISVFTVVDANLRGPELAPLTVHRLGGSERPVWQSATAITDRIRANFGDVFANQRESSIYELAPTGPNTFVATIGTPQNILYRVTGRGDLTQDPCLVGLDGVVLRCGPIANTGQFGPGLAVGGAAPAPGAAAPVPSVPAAPADSDLGTLSDAQLADLLRRAAEESARRVTEGGS